MNFVTMHSRTVYTTSNGTTADKLERIRKKSDSCHHTRHVSMYGKRGTAPLTFNFGSRRKRVVNVTSLSLYPREITQIPIKQENGWASVTNWTCC